MSHPDLFVSNVQGVWIHPDAQPVDDLMHVTKGSPSGAIRVIRDEQGEAAQNLCATLFGKYRARS